MKQTDKLHDRLPSSTHPIALTSKYRCRKRRNVEICHVFE